MSDDPKVYYSVPGYGEAIGFFDAVVDRDADVEAPSMANKRWQAMKYVVRAPRKNGAADIKKAIDYLERLLVDLREVER